MTGTLFFVPAAGFLDDLPDPPGGGVAEDGTTPDGQSLPDDFLAMGERKGSTA